VERPIKGTPQGGVLSPLLANVVLNDLDHWVNSKWRTRRADYRYKQADYKYKALRKSTKLKGWYIVRYADDVKIICETKTAARRAYEAATNYLKAYLKLEISPEKSGVVNVKKHPTEFLGLSIKAEKKAKKWVAQSHMQEKAITRTCADIKAQAKTVQHATGTARMQAIRKLQSMILGKHNYYRMATQVSRDMGEVSYQVKRVISNRCQPVTVHGSKIARWMRQRYGKPKGGYLSIDGNIIPPIHLIQHKPPMNFSQAKLAREKGTADLDAEIRNMLQTDCWSSTEYLSGKVSRYLAQKGKCHITGKPLRASEAHAHHRKPKADGGSDEYSNLVILHEEAHRLVHATTPETVSEHTKNLALTKEQLRKLNKLRSEAGNYKLRTA
jgi:5-methylcytosine-specific restriction endonuclease McrA